MCMCVCVHIYIYRERERERTIPQWRIFIFIKTSIILTFFLSLEDYSKNYVTSVFGLTISSTVSILFFFFLLCRNFHFRYSFFFLLCPYSKSSFLFSWFVFTSNLFILLLPSSFSTPTKL